jgi:predicted nucleotidyltransferase
MKLQKEMLEEIKKLLIRAYDPVEIYIFGSHAWGEPGEDSDLDLLIVIDILRQKPWEEQSLGHKVLFDIDIPKDIIVLSKSDFDDRSKQNVSIFHKIKEEGVRIYARA